MSKNDTKADVILVEKQKNGANSNLKKMNDLPKNSEHSAKRKGGSSQHGRQHNSGGSSKESLRNNRTKDHKSTSKETQSEPSKHSNRPSSSLNNSGRDWPNRQYRYGGGGPANDPPRKPHPQKSTHPGRTKTHKNLDTVTEKSNGSNPTKSDADLPSPDSTTTNAEAFDAEHVLVTSPTDDSTKVVCSDVGKTLSRHVYEREALLSIRECTLSVMTPAGFDLLSADITKDILKTDHRVNCCMEGSTSNGDELSKHHSGPLVLPPKDDQKSNTKVSLMPQRRSFGGGCSWRDHQKQSTGADPPTPGGTNEEGGGDWSVVGVGSKTVHKVIEHVPYRSRQGGANWKPTNDGNWRDKGTATESLYDDEEPEWMSFGPSDKYELMELKGIDDHEKEREAMKTSTETKSKDDSKSLSDDSPSSSPLEKTMPRNEVDSGLPSSCPNDDEDGFMLDGFDFKAVLSICQELASDSGEEDPIEKDSLIKAKDTHQLKNALISVLGIEKDDSQPGSNVGHPRVPHPMDVVNALPPEPQVVTLDEIEGGNTACSGDQSAFDKFLASMSTNSVTDDTHQLINQPSVNNRSRLRSYDQAMLQENHAHQINNSPPISRTHSTSMYSSPTHFSPVRHVDTPHHHDNQQRWSPNIWSEGEHTIKPPATSPHLFNPSPSSIGMHPHHLRQQQKNMPGGGVGMGGASGNWVSKMEQVRVAELNQRMQQQQLQQQQQERQARMQQKFQNGNGSSFGFLPTSVMRHIHNSNPNQSIKEVTNRAMTHSTIGDHVVRHPTEKAMGVGFVGGMHSPEVSTYLPSHSQFQYPMSPQYHPTYHHHHHRPAGVPLVDMATQRGGGYHPVPPMSMHHHIQQPPSPFVKMGVSPLKPGLY